MKPKTSFIQQKIFYNSSEYVRSLGVVWVAISLMMIAVSVTAQPAHNGHVKSQNGNHSAEYFNRNAISGIAGNTEEPGSAIVIARDELQITVSGQVTDQQTGQPLPGVNIVVEGTAIGTASDSNGEFSLQVEDLNQVLVFTYIGYQRKVVQLDGESELAVSLTAQAIEGDDVIVVAFGEQSREEFVGSAINISARQFENRAVTNPTQILEGSSPGVMFAGSSGQPGSGTNVRIRGVGSVSGSSAPLYVVDGAIFTGSLSTINPNSIESMTILKDAASTALYGSGAANGVIMITTKRGQSEPQISVNMSHGFVDRGVKEYERVDAYDYYPLMWESFRNRNVYSEGMSMEEAGEAASNEVFTQLGYNPFGQYYSDLSRYPTDGSGNPILNDIVLPNGQLNPAISSLAYDDDWADGLTRTGQRSNMDLNFSGATSSVNYNATVGYTNEAGYLENSDFERLNAALRLDSDLSNRIRANVNLRGNLSESLSGFDGSTTAYVNPYRATRLMGPIYPLMEVNRFTGQHIEGGSYDHGLNRPEASGRHAVWENMLNRDNRKTSNLAANTVLEVRITDNIRFRNIAGITRDNRNRYRNRTGLIGDAAPVGDGYRYNEIRNDYSFQQLIDFDFTYRFHNLSGVLGHDSFQHDWEYMTMRRSGQVSDGNLELINYVNLESATSYTRTYRKEGYMARLNYDFDSRYYLSGSYRYDGSSRFEESVRWDSFWSIGAKWRVLQESFIPSIAWLDQLDLKVSYGQVGNDSHISHGSLSFYAYQPLYQLGRNNADEAGILLNTAGNPDLQWESNNQLDIGVEFSMYQGRVNGSVEFYNRESSNLLFDVPLPPSSGLTDYPDNIGTMFNRGFEFELDMVPVQTQNFNWNVQLHAATITNEFKSLPQEEIRDGTKMLRVGTSIYEYYLRDWYGVDPSDGAALYVASPEAIEAGGDDIRTVDGTVVTTNHLNANESFHGSALPNLYGGITNTFAYKGFSIRALVSYQIGGKTYDGQYALLMHAGTSAGRSMHKDLLNRWQQPGDITNVPRLDYNRASEFNAGTNSRWLVTSSYLSLRNLNISYSLPPQWTTQIGLSNATIFANGENLFQLTARPGLEANQQFNGTTLPRYQSSRVLTLGLNLTF